MPRGNGYERIRIENTIGRVWTEKRSEIKLRALTGRLGTGVGWMAEPIEPTHAQIRERAYQIFEERGREHGGNLEDWLSAEQQLRAAAFESLMRTIVDRRVVMPRKTQIHFEEAGTAAAA